MALENFTASIICYFAKTVTGVRAVWHASEPKFNQRVYFSNHTSHGDFVLIWALLPAAIRLQTRPVARAEYWLRGKLRQYVINQVFRGVLINHTTGKHHPLNPLEQMCSALENGDSLIVFPEGTRNLDEGLLPFKSGLFYLAKKFPEVEFIPVWIENLDRVMPKGALIPVPLLCTLTFGPGLEIIPDENKNLFLKRAMASLLALAPTTE